MVSGLNIKKIVLTTAYSYKKYTDLCNPKTLNIWMFPKIVVPQNGWFILENPIKMDDLGGFTPIFGNTHI